MGLRISSLNYNSLLEDFDSIGLQRLSFFDARNQVKLSARLSENNNFIFLPVTHPPTWPI